MNTARRERSRSNAARLSLLMATLALASASSLADTKGEMADARARHQQERAACKSASADQDRASCLRDADAAFADVKQETKQGAKDDSAATLTRNASKRCDALPDEDRQACIARMKGQGRTTGSVAKGGIYRELVTTEPDPTRPASDAASIPAK
jgi:hypothetical protein